MRSALGTGCRERYAAKKYGQGRALAGWEHGKGSLLTEGLLRACRTINNARRILAQSHFEPTETKIAFSSKKRKCAIAIGCFAAQPTISLRGRLALRREESS